MIAAALLAVALAALPEGIARYRAELGGEPLGVAELRVACAGSACAVTYDSRLRLPDESGGVVVHARVELAVDREGRWRGGPIAVARDGERRVAAGVDGAVPASVLELVLAAPAEAGERCVAFFDEREPAEATACARRDGARVSADADGVPLSIAPGADGFPEEVAVAGRLRFVRDPSADVPARAPRLAGTRVPGPADPGDAARFCGVALDPPAGAAPPLPPPRAPGESCRERAAAYLAAARARGIRGRTAVGVAWDGSAFVWHAWAELLAGGRWIAVDPSFGQLPAAGPRFTVGRFGPRDARGRNEAGARILACWGRARVEAR